MTPGPTPGSENFIGRNIRALDPARASRALARLDAIQLSALHGAGCKTAIEQQDQKPLI